VPATVKVAGTFFTAPKITKKVVDLKVTLRSILLVRLTGTG
jgi:hypothetical protein